LLWAISFWFRHWNNFKNWPTFAKVTVKIKVAQFFLTHSVQVCHFAATVTVTSTETNQIRAKRPERPTYITVLSLLLISFVKFYVTYFGRVRLSFRRQTVEWAQRLIHGSATCTFSSTTALTLCELKVWSMNVNDCLYLQWLCWLRCPTSER